MMSPLKTSTRNPPTNVELYFSKNSSDKTKPLWKIGGGKPLKGMRVQMPNHGTYLYSAVSIPDRLKKEVKITVYLHKSPLSEKQSA